MKFKAAKVSGKQAAEALIALFGQISFVHHQNIHIEFAPATPHVDLQARVHILGHSYTIVCALYDAHGKNLDALLRHLRSAADKLGSNALPVLIASTLSPDAQQQCRNASIGYLDLAGNARILLDEVFIATQTRTASAFLRKPLATAPLQTSTGAVA